MSGARGGGWDCPVDGGCCGWDAETGGRAVGGMEGSCGCGGGGESSRGSRFSGSTYYWRCAMWIFLRHNGVGIHFFACICVHSLQKKAFAVFAPEIGLDTFWSDGSIYLDLPPQNTTSNWGIEFSLLWIVETGTSDYKGR